MGFRWNSYLDFARLADCASRSDMRQILSRIDCFNCDFSPASLIRPSEDKAAVQAYAKVHGLKTPRGIGIPDFVRYEPGMVPGPYASEEDQDAMGDALSAAIHVADRLAQLRTFPALGFTEEGIHPSDRPGQDIPLFIPDGKGSFTETMTILPGRTPEASGDVAFNRPELTMQIALLPVRSHLECRFITMDTAPVAEKGQQPFFPTLMLCVDGNTGLVSMTKIGRNREAFLSETVEDLALRIIADGVRPGSIFVEDDLTANMLRDFCARTGITLRRVSRLKHLEEAWDSLSAALGGRR